MGSSDAERLSVLETQHDDVIRRIDAVEGAVTTLSQTVNDFIHAQEKEREYRKGQAESDRRWMKVGFVILGAMIPAAQVLAPIIQKWVE